MNWKRWNWLNEGVFPLALTLMRVCLVWLWLALAQRWFNSSYQQDIVLPMWLMGGLLLASMVITHWSMRQAKTLKWARLVVSSVGLVILFLLLWWLFYRFQYPLWDIGWVGAWGQETLFWTGGMPPWYLIAPTIVYLWLRGIIDGSRLLERRDITNMFTAGSIGLVLWILVSRLDSQSLPEEAGNLVLLFFAAAMLGLAFSSLETDALSVTGQEQQKHRLNRYWLGSVLTIIASLLGLGLLLSLLLVPETVARLSSWAWNVLSEVLIFLIKLISLILYPLLYLLALILPPILKGILARYRIGWLSEPEALPERSDPTDPFGALYKAVKGLPAELSWVGLVILILGIGLVFMLALRYLLSEIDETGVEERRDFIFSKELLLAQLSLWWPQWLSRLRRISYLANDPYLSVADELSPRRAIREIYQKMLAAARERGQPRLQNQTPVEYGHELGQSLPGVEAELEVITMRYMQARYDSELPTQEQVLETRQAWEQLEARLRE